MPAASLIKALIVDDQASLRQHLANTLKELKFTQITQRSDGEKALEYLQDNPVHLIISDFNMPNINGLELLKTIRANPKLKKCAFIMLTGEANKELVQESIKAGVNNFLVKPYTPQKLRETIEKVFGPLT